MLHRLPAIFLSLLAPMWPAPSFAAPACDPIARQDLLRLAAETSAQLMRTPVIAAGEPFMLHWRRGEMRGRYPAYLMISFDAPVRFEGKGFYVLMPKASAAFGIRHFADATRAVIPLYGLGVPAQGEFAARPLLAGPLNVQWAVVGHDRCKELVAQDGHGSMSLRVGSTGSPEIVVSDVLAGESPKQRIFSPAGGRVIEVHEGRYRLVDEASRAEIAERAGRTPRFSPTGRFLAAYVEDGIEIIDAVDGKTVYKNSPGYELAWDNADSFAILGQGAWGSLALLMPSRVDSELLPNPPGGYACHGCDAIQSVALRVDLENNVAVFIGEGGGGAASLTTSAQNSPDRWAGHFSVAGSLPEIVAFVERQSKVTDFALPKRWELRGGLKFSHLGFYEPEKGAHSDRYRTALQKFLVRPLAVSVSSSKPAGGDAVQVVKWRGVFGAEKATSRKMLQRLREFGLPIPEDGGSQDKLSFVRDVVLLGEVQDGGLPLPENTKRMKETSQKIEREVRAARGVFDVRGQEGGHCYPFSDRPGEAANKVYDEFQRAFRFKQGDRTIWITQLQCQDGSAAFHNPSVTLFDSAAAAAWFLDRDTGDSNTNVGTVCASNVAFCDFDAHLSNGRFLMLSSAKSRAIEIFDIDERRNVFRKYDLPRGDLLAQAMLSPDRQLVLQINSDGSFAGFRFADAKLLFEGRYVDDEVVVWTLDARFDATSEGAHYVSLRLPGRIANYTFEQFSARLKTPGLVAKLMAGETFQLATLASPPSLKGIMQVKEGRVRGTAEAAADTELTSLMIFQDGLLSDRLAAPANGRSWDFDVKLLPGTRWVSMVALDKEGLASLPMGRALAAPQALPRRVHILAIGIDDYADPRIGDLALARSDARRFAGAVGSIGRDVIVASSRILHEKEATREGVLAALQQVTSAAAPGETVLLFFAGHGVRSDDGSYFLATPDTSLDDIKATALPWSDVAGILTQSKTRIAVFLDTCHSGAAGTGAFSTNDAAARSLLERIPSGIVVFSASKGRELSEEAAAAGGGLFTSALVKVIAAERARFDSNRNGAIEISELYRGVKAQVTAITDGRQTPWIARNEMVGDFVLF